MRGNEDDSPSLGGGGYDSAQHVVQTTIIAVAVLAMASLLVGGASAATAAQGGAVSEVSSYDCHDRTQMSGGDGTPMSGGVFAIASAGVEDHCQSDSSSGDNVPPEVLSFNATLQDDTTVLVVAEFDEQLSDGYVRLYDEEGNRLGHQRMGRHSRPDFEYDATFSVSGDAGDSYHAVLYEAKDRSFNPVEDPGQYDDWANVSEPTQESTSDPTPTTTEAPTVTDTPEDTTEPTTVSGDSDSGGDGSTATTTTTVATTEQPAEDDPNPEDPSADPGSDDSLDTGLIVLLLLAVMLVVGSVYYYVRQRGGA
jgi:hypothetical protein